LVSEEKFVLRDFFQSNMYNNFVDLLICHCPESGVSSWLFRQGATKINAIQAGAILGYEYGGFSCSLYLYYCLIVLYSIF